MPRFKQFCFDILPSIDFEQVYNEAFKNVSQSVAKFVVRQSENKWRYNKACSFSVRMSLASGFSERVIPCKDVAFCKN